jgi:hypothetical protein
MDVANVLRGSLVDWERHPPHLWTVLKVIFALKAQQQVQKTAVLVAITLTGLTLKWSLNVLLVHLDFIVLVVHQQLAVPASLVTIVLEKRLLPRIIRVQLERIRLQQTWWTRLSALIVHQDPIALED